MGGIVGRLFREFAVTLSTAIFVSYRRTLRWVLDHPAPTLVVLLLTIALNAVLILLSREFSMAGWRLPLKLTRTPFRGPRTRIGGGKGCSRFTY
jgi:hypothetical protein